MSDEEYNERLQAILRLPPEERIEALRKLEEERKRRLEEFKKQEQEEKKRLERARELIEKTLHDIEEEEIKKKQETEQAQKLEEIAEEVVVKKKEEKEEEIVKYKQEVEVDYRLINPEVYYAVKEISQAVYNNNATQEDIEVIRAIKSKLEEELMNNQNANNEYAQRTLSIINNALYKTNILEEKQQDLYNRRTV